MTASDSNDPSLPPPEDSAIKPSWKPLLWLTAGLGTVIALGEVFFDVLLEGLELLGEGIFYAVEGSEELLEDKIEEWFDLDPYHAEIVTAWALTPVKLVLGVLILMWLWRLGQRKLFPRVRRYFNRQYHAVQLAWRALWWPYRILMILAISGGLLILI